MKRIFTALSVMMALLVCFAMPAFALDNTPVSYSIAVQSVRTGDVPSTAESITYYLQSVDGAPMPTTAVSGTTSLAISASATTTASFDAITYTAPGVYEYLLWQQAGSDGYATYDSTVCLVQVYIYTDQSAVLSVEGTHSYVNSTGYKDDFSFSTSYDYPAVVVATEVPVEEEEPAATATPRPVTAAVATASPEPTAAAAVATAAPATATAAPTASAVPTVTIEDGDIALEDGGFWETLQDMATPLTSLFSVGDSWALINLILAVVTTAASIVLIVGYFLGRKAKEDGDEADADTTQSEADANAEAAKATTIKRKNKGFARAFSVLPALVSIVLFILTEDMSTPMCMIDRWTLAMVLFALIQVFVAIVSRKRDEEVTAKD